MSAEIKKLDYIDAVRGIAVLLVLLVHTLTFLGGSNLNHFFRMAVEQGRMGVQLFYIASAFTLFYSMSQRGVTEKFSNINFYIRRFFRIAPLFYVATAYYFWQYTAFPAPAIGAADVNSFTVWNVLSHLTFTHGLSPYWINTIVPGGWSVAVEMMFYLFVPAFYLLYTKYGVKFLYLALALSVAVSWVLDYTAFYYLGTGMSEYWHAFLYYNFFTQLPVFVFGMIIYDHVISNRNSLKPVFIISSASLVLFLLSLFLNKYTASGVFAGSMLFLSAVLGLAVILLSRWSPKLIVNKFSRYIGKISYSMYLVHFAAIFVIMSIFEEMLLGGNEVVFLGCFLALVALTVAISSLTYRYIEKPFIIIGNKLIARLNTK